MNKEQKTDRAYNLKKERLRVQRDYLEAIMVNNYIDLPRNFTIEISHPRIYIGPKDSKGDIRFGCRIEICRYEENEQAYLKIHPSSFGTFRPSEHPEEVQRVATLHSIFKQWEWAESAMLQALKNVENINWEYYDRLTQIEKESK